MPQPHKRPAEAGTQGKDPQASSVKKKLKEKPQTLKAQYSSSHLGHCPLHKPDLKTH